MRQGCRKKNRGQDMKNLEYHAKWFVLYHENPEVLNLAAIWGAFEKNVYTWVQPSSTFINTFLNELRSSYFY